uniref:RRM domain-containing protein n=1 Tax=Ciona savignyi TaxID=51511 RepID=H2YDR1_CIOSA
KSGHFCDVLVLLYCGTNGENSPELLGSDESELVIIAWQLLDLQLNQTGDIHYICVQSESDSTQKNKWKEITGISEGVVANAPVFADAIQQFEHAIRNELNEKGRTCSFALCTDGQAHIRQVLMPTSIRDNTQLPEFCYSFFDLKKEFSRCCPDTSPSNAMDCDFQNYTSIEDMLNYLQVNVKEHDTFGVDHVRRMSSVVQLLISTKYGHVFVEPETVTDRLETGPCMTSELINDNTVVRARGLPWQASDHDVARFFKGLNIPRGGAALVLNPQGRRNGEALVRFENSQQRDLALLRHKHHMGNRYIEVYRATSDEFLKVAAGSSCEAIHFLSKEGEAIVRMRGLPFTAVARDIVDFFGDDIPVAHDEGGILLVKYADGRPTGDAFVLFSSEQIAVAALNKHKLTLGKRYVEIFKSTAAEVQQVLSRHMTSPIIPTMPAPAMPLSFAVPIGSVRNCIRLRGMPYSATVEDITLFLGDLACCILPHGIHMVLNQQGRPSGDAFIQLSSVEKCSMAALDVSKGGCHKKHMGERYVEVFQCSGDEMNMVLMGGTLNRNGMLPPPGMEPMPAPPVSVPATFPAHPAPPTHPIEIIHPHTLFAAAPRTIYQQVSSETQYPPYLPYTPYLPTPPVSPTTPPAMPIQQANQPPIPVQGSGIQVRMQGMPFNAGVTDILSFFKGFNVS